MKIVNGRVFNGAGFDQVTVYINGEVFVDEASYVDDGVVIDAAGKVVAPGFIDQHFHKAAGADASDGTEEAFHILAAWEAAQGVTAICPATMTFPEEILGPVCDAAAAFVPAGNEAALVGLNMEGPFISPKKVGAQNPEYVQAPNAEMFLRLQERAKGLIRLVDIAPEEPGALEFIQAVKGCTNVSLAHMCANYDEALAAFQAGATQLTHLYNAMPGLTHRAPGPIAAAADSQAFAEIIADGIHIHPSMVRLAFRIFGAERMILVSDTVAAGLPEGSKADLGGQTILVGAEVATLEDGTTLAGSVKNLALCVQTAVTKMDIPLADALRAATLNPARAIGVDSARGSIAPGKVADAVILDPETVAVEQVILRGAAL